MGSIQRHHRILLTGATGYVGGRLLTALMSAGHDVRCLARRPEYLMPRIKPPNTVVTGDVLNASSLEGALEGCDIAFYLVHSMGSSGSFEEQDRLGSTNFANAARHSALKRIIYLGGLADDEKVLSPHLRSRLEVGRILRTSGIPVVELRASIVIGSGSLSFELVRALAEHLPVMLLPRWVSVVAQPIGIEDLIDYLVASMDISVQESVVIEIGGADVVSYRDLIVEYARQRGLRRLLIPVPVLTPRLSSLWLGLVTPLYARVGRKLIDSIRHPTVVRHPAAQGLFDIKPLGVADAMASAIRNEDREFAETRWSGALSSAVSAPFGGVRLGNRIFDSRVITVPVPPAMAFAPIQLLGGKNGWYAYDFLWRLRGAMDLALGGVGMRRGRPDRDLRVGDPLDFWRVEAYEPPFHLRLAAEMRVPGRAWLEYEVKPAEGGSTIRQTAIFDPAGLAGLAYWYGIYPAHALIFRRLIQAIARKAGYSLS
jgi:uncharacterized protein YbjT (DUF2867 family)